MKNKKPYHSLYNVIISIIIPSCMLKKYSIVLLFFIFGQFAFSQNCADGLKKIKLVSGLNNEKLKNNKLFFIIGKGKKRYYVKEGINEYFACLPFELIEKYNAFLKCEGNLKNTIGTYNYENLSGGLLSFKNGDFDGCKFVITGTPPQPSGGKRPNPNNNSSNQQSTIDSTSILKNIVLEKNRVIAIQTHEKQSLKDSLENMKIKDELSEIKYEELKSRFDEKVIQLEKNEKERDFIQNKLDYFEQMNERRKSCPLPACFAWKPSDDDEKSTRNIQDFDYMHLNLATHVPEKTNEKNYYVQIYFIDEIEFRAADTLLKSIKVPVKFTSKGEAIHLERDAGISFDKINLKDVDYIRVDLIYKDTFGSLPLCLSYRYYKNGTFEDNCITEYVDLSSKISRKTHKDKMPDKNGKRSRRNQDRKDELNFETGCCFEKK